MNASRKNSDETEREQLEPVQENIEPKGLAGISSQLSLLRAESSPFVDEPRQL